MYPNFGSILYAYSKKKSFIPLNPDIEIIYGFRSGSREN